jgi:hypothetical protein
VRTPDPAPPHPRSSIEELLAPPWARAVPACLWMGAVLAASVVLSSGYALPHHALLGPIELPLDLMPVAILAVAAVWAAAALLMWQTVPLVLIVLLIPVGMDSWAPLPPGPARYAVELDSALSCSLAHVGVAAGEEVASLLGSPGDAHGADFGSCLQAADDVTGAVGRGVRAALEFAVGAMAGLPVSLGEVIARRLETAPPAAQGDVSGGDVLRVLTH